MATKISGKARILINGVEIQSIDAADVEIHDQKNDPATVVETWCEECQEYFQVNYHGHFKVRLEKGPSD